MRLIVVFIIILTCIISSCEKLSLEESNSDVAVVEAYIQPGDSIQLYVTRQIVYGSSDTVEQVMEELDVTVFDGDSHHTLIYQADGLYIGGSMNIEAGDQLELEFSYHNALIHSETVIPEKPTGFTVSQTTITAWERPDEFDPGNMPEMPDPVEFSWANEDDDYHLVVVENIEEDPVTINDVDEDEDRPRPNFRSMPTQGISTVLPVMTFEYYGMHRVILFRLNAEYAALYEQLGNSSLDIQEPPSNIENGLGIFTGINSDTLYVNVVD